VSAFPSHETIVDMIARRARDEPAHVYCTFEGRSLTIAELHARSEACADALLRAGFRPGDRIAIMLRNSIDHVILFFACIRAGLVQVPINVAHVGASLSFLLEHSGPRGLVVESALAQQVRPVIDERAVPVVYWRGGVPSAHREERDRSLETLLGHRGTPGIPAPGPEALVYLGYTSGTTGMPKGVMLTEKMVRGTALGSILIGTPRPGDVYYLWEPIYHVTGSETLVIGVMERVTLALTDRFSASRFWDECRQAGATHIHYVGGVLQILLRQPPSPRDREHRVRIAWGGGCPVQTWRLFEERYGVELREGYGMTETSSFCTINTDRKVGSVGTSVPWFDVRVMREDGSRAAFGEEGQIVVKELEPGMNTRGYFNNPEATRALLPDEWLRTGDRGVQEGDGHIIFRGRFKDSVRRRGENISAWEVERVINAHPLVEESALIGVTNELGDEDLKIFVRPTDGADLDASALLEWCKPRMPGFQVPRFVAFVKRFDKTPSERIRKSELSRATTDCWDAERPAQ
jgi:crotonobetaine/carnitine-CoA ligase